MPRISHYEADGTRVLVSEESSLSSSDRFDRSEWTDCNDDDSLTSLLSLDDYSLEKENDSDSDSDSDSSIIHYQNDTTRTSTTSTERSTNDKKQQSVVAAKTKTTAARGTSARNKKLLPKKLKAHLGTPKGGGYWKLKDSNSNTSDLLVDDSTEAKDRALAMALAEDSSRTIYDSIKMGQRRRRVRVVQTNTAYNNFDPKITTTLAEETTPTTRTKRGGKKRGRIQKKRGKNKRRRTRNKSTDDIDTDIDIDIDINIDTEEDTGARKNSWKTGDWCFITTR
uniref:Uncharacterized protein n=1 Tax=Pseudo-nitzschia australis TaxID=44445 RepID=A0A7S4EJ70_9STRA